MSVYKRGQTYWYEFAFAGSRIRESARTDSKRIAQEAERKRRRDLELGVNRIAKPAEIPLFKAAAEKLLEDKRARRARNTGELYRFALKPVVSEFGKRLICDISPEDIALYQTKRLRAGLSPRTINIEVGAIRAVLKAHRLWGPIADAVEMLRERKDVGRALSHDEERKLIEAAGRSRSSALLPLLITTLDTGLRAAEIRSLRRGDLKLDWKNGAIEAGFITVPKSKTEAGTGRTIPLSRRVCAALTLWLSRFPETDSSAYVFPRHSVGLLGNSRKPYVHGLAFSEPIGEWKKAWKDACAATGAHFRWHDLRHTFITRLAERPEISEQTIMSLAGHVSRSMLARYSHIRNQAKQEAIEALERANAISISAVENSISAAAGPNLDNKGSISGSRSPQKSPQPAGELKTILKCEEESLRND